MTPRLTRKEWDEIWERSVYKSTDGIISGFMAVDTHKLERLVHAALRKRGKGKGR